MGSETTQTSRLWSCIHLTTLLAFLFSPVGASAQVTQTVGSNVNISQLSENQNEAAIAINPTNPQQLFAFSNREFGGALFAARSTDGGQTWQPSNGADFFIADGNGNLPRACCDPTVAWDGFGNLFIAYLTFSSATVEPFKVAVALSTDGGETFTLLSILGGTTDQPTIVTGPGSAGAPGSVWVTYRELAEPGLVAQGAPVNGLGAVGSFSAPQVAPGTSGDGSFGDIAIGPAGQVLVTYQIPTSGEGPATIYVNLDADGLGAGGFGSQMTATTTNVGGFDFIPPQSFRSVDAEAGLAYDRSGGVNDGRVYLVYTDESPNESDDTNIFVRFSEDDGATWSAPVRVNDDASTNSQFLPRIALDQTTGVLAVSWHDSRNDDGLGGPGDTDNTPNTDAQLFATVSVDGGGTFLPNVQVSAGTSNALDALAQVDYGDYTGLAFFDGSFYPAWADNSDSTGDNPNGPLTRFDIYTARVDVEEVVSISVPVDIKPRGCRNPLNVKAKGVLPVAILGTSSFDVTQVDVTTVQLEGVRLLRSSLADVATPFVPFTGKADAFDCTAEGPDGVLDLTLKFDSQAVVAALGPVTDGEVRVLQLTGNLLDGTAIVGEDVVVILKKGKQSTHGEKEKQHKK